MQLRENSVVAPFSMEPPFSGWGMGAGIDGVHVLSARRALLRISLYGCVFGRMRPKGLPGASLKG